MGVDFCHVYCFARIEHEFNGSDYRGHVDFSVNGADYGYRIRSRNQ